MAKLVAMEDYGMPIIYEDIDDINHIDAEVVIETTAFLPLLDHNYYQIDNKKRKVPKSRNLNKEPPFVFQCFICGYMTNSKATSQKHKEMHRQIEPGTSYMKCTSCDQCPGSSQIKKENPIFKCKKCSYESRSGKSLKVHERFVHERGAKLKCQDCQFVTSKLSELVKHYKYGHASTQS